jgi:TM2 domain-containing membrane protein YozV
METNTSAEPVPTHHISDASVWKGADRNFYIFAVLSILFGFIGVDHFYLRSFGTGTQKAAMNFATLGLWYWWDLAQVLTDGHTVRSEGLSSPFDWIRGIGRGVFETVPMAPLSRGQGQSGGGPVPSAAPPAPAQKSYLLYAFLAVFFGWLGADKFYLGYFGQGLAKVLSCFNIFLFLFGWLWVVWDSVFAFFFTPDILKNGISPPMPFSIFFRDPIPPTLFQMGHVAPQDGGSSIWDWLTCPPVPSFMKGWFPGAGAMNSAKEVYDGVVKPLLTPPLTAALAVMEQASPGTADRLGDMADKMGSFRQTGGGGGAAAAAEPATGVGPILGGTLTAIILAGGLKGTYDFISKQYG